jgi:AAA domain
MGALLMSHQFVTDLLGKPDAEKIEALKTKAKDLVTLRVEHSEALAQLRGFNNLIEGPCRDPELVVFLRAAKRGRTTIADLVKPGDRLSMKRMPFMLDGVFTPQDTNLVVGREKKGKTSFVIAWISAWHFGQQRFCDFDIAGDCPPVIVIGPDMTEQQWGRMLHQYHLANADGELNPDGPIKQLLHMGHQFALDQHGLDLIDQLGELHPGALFIFDSYSRLVDPLGLQEATSEFAGPLIQAQGILAKHQATGIWLHHSAANRDTGKASSRGSTALPAASDQIIYLEYPTANEDDKRTLLRTKGRDVPVTALLERTEPDGVWICHASGEDLERQRKVQSRIDKLRPGIALDAFEAMQRIHHDHPLGCDLKQLADAIGTVTPDQLRKGITRLLALGLITEHSPAASGTNGGRPASRYRLQQAVSDLLGLAAKKVAAQVDKDLTLITPNIPDTPNTPETPAGLPSALPKGLSPETAPNTPNTPETSAGGVSGHLEGVSGVSAFFPSAASFFPTTALTTNGHRPASEPDLTPDW